MAISVHELIKKYPHVEVLTEKNGTEVTTFFNQAAMSGGGLHLLMQRNPNYFDLIHCRSNLCLLLGLRDDAGKLIGVGAACTYPGYLRGKPVNISYWADLRVQAKEKHLKVEWRGLFEDLMTYSEQLIEMGTPYCTFTVVIDTNEKARRVLTERLVGAKKLVPVCPYSMISLVGRFPKFGGKSKYAISIAKDSELEEIETFLEECNLQQAYGYRFKSPDFELRRRLKTWPGFSLKDFYIVRDNSGKIIATTGLWDPTSIKQIVVEGPWWTNLFNIILRPLGLPGFGDPMRILYMTTLSFSKNLPEAEKKTVFSDLVDFVWPEKRKRKAQMLAYVDFTEHSIKEALKGYFKLPTPVMLYHLVDVNKVESFKKSELGEFPPSFEVAAT